MSINIIPDCYQIDGPWLITKEDLSKLNISIGEVWNQYEDELKKFIVDEYKIKEITNEVIDKHIKEYFATHPYKAHYCKVKIYLKSNKVERQYDSIIDILKDISLTGENLVGIKIVVKSLDNLLDLDLANDNINQSLKYRVESNEIRIKEDVIYIVNNWIDKTKSSKPVQFWRKLGGFTWVIGLFIIYLFTPLWNAGNSYSSVLKKEAIKYIESGVNETNHYEVLSLLLQLNAEYTPNWYVKNYSSYFTVVAIILVLSLVSSIAPKTTIGVGKGEIKVKMWKLWIYVLTIFIPISIILPIILSRI